MWLWNSAEGLAGILVPGTQISVSSYAARGPPASSVKHRQPRLGLWLARRIILTVCFLGYPVGPPSRCSCAAPIPFVTHSLLVVPFFPAESLQPLLDVSLTAINLLRPVYRPGGEVIEDFTLEYLNPAGQRIMSRLADLRVRQLRVLAAARRAGAHNGHCPHGHRRHGISRRPVPDAAAERRAGRQQ